MFCCFRAYFIVFCGCLLLWGCSTENSLPVAELSGLVTLNGEPVTNGTISFIPVDKSTPTCGVGIKNGRYSAKVPKGIMLVNISSPKVVGQSKAFDAPDSPTVDVTEETIPAIYNSASTLKQEVTHARDDVNFELNQEKK